MDSSGSSPHITQKDIARALGLTQATVSFALRDDPRIPQKRRQEIQAAAQAMGYRPNPTAAVLAHFKRSSSVKPVHAALAWINGWAEPEKLRSWREFNAYWTGASAAAAKHGYRLEEFTCGADLSAEALQSILLARGIQGILLPPHQEPIEWGRFDWSQFSIVRFGRSLPSPATHVVTSDQVANTMRAFREVQRLGYQRIGYFGSPTDAPWGLFEAGYLLAQLLLPPAQRLTACHQIDADPHRGQEIFTAWLEREKPDAVLTDNAAAIEMIRAAGYRVPEDIGVAAMSILDGNSNAGIDQNSEEIGRAAAETLIGMLHTHQRGIPHCPRQILVDGYWVEGSMMPPAQKKRPRGRKPKPGLETKTQTQSTSHT
jgi:DNA-binding LacI/PurR family transcriptional regulator